MPVKGGQAFANKPGEKMVVLCTTNSGGMEIRMLETFERLLSVNGGDNEIVKSVDGETKKKVRFTLIKRVLGDLVDANFKGLTDKHREQIIYAFYTANGYKTRINKGVAE